MGIQHGKERNAKLRNLNNCPVEPVSRHDTNSLEPIDRSFVVVWCDATIGLNSNSDDDKNTLMQLARVLNRKRQLIHTFNEIEPCRNFIQNVNNICLIISGQMGTALVPSIHNSIQIHSIFIFCMNKPKYEAWAKDYPKIRGVFNDIKEICDFLKPYFITQTSSECEQLQFDLLNKDITLPITDILDISFIYPLLSKKILFNMKSIKHQDMINYCQMEYTNEYQTHVINEFQNNYSQYNPIWWFTRDRFFQGIINRSLQVQDFYTLCTMNPFIKDLDNQLTDLYRQQITSAPKILYLYLSQSISKDSFEKLKLNIGGLMCINQFLFANTEQAIALLFIENQNSTSVDTNTINVLFEIYISKKIQPNVSYANVGSISEFVHEKEYLLSMSSIFRVDQIGKLEEIPSVYSIHITLIDKNDSKLANLTRIINTEILYENNDLSELGSNITNKLYQFKCTRKLFQQTLNSRAKLIRPILLHYNMGIIYDCLNDYNKAVDQFKFAINLTRSSVPSCQQKDSICLVPFYSNLGLSYQQINRCKEAFEHAFRTLVILSNDGVNSIFKKELTASSHFNLGLILDLQNKINEAKLHYEQAFKIRREYLPNNHPDIIHLQEIIASLSSTPNESID